MKTNLLALSIAFFACGCSPAPVQPTGPTYAEAVATYHAEVALLDSLEAKLADAKSKLEAERAAIKSRFEAEQKKSDEHELFIFNGFSDPEKAKPHLAENQEHMNSMRSIRDKESALAVSNYKRVADPLVAEIESQRASVAKAKAFRDSLSP